MKRRKWIVIVSLGIGLMIFMGLVFPVESVFDDPYSTVLESNNGSLLGARIASDGQWRFPNENAVPEKFRYALLSYEDQYFYYHWGVNPISIGRALMQNLSEGRIVSGGSTITMQVARLAQGNQPRTVLQKIKEIWMAERLELQFSKKEILEMYVSHAPFGGNVVGLSAASWRYYGRSPENLSWAESANLAVLPNAPSLIFPGRNDSSLMNKRNRLLQALHKKEVLTSSELELAMREPIPLKPQPLPAHASHLLDRAVQDGKGGTIIQSSLDLDLQRSVQELVDHHYTNFKSKQIHNAAAIVIDIETGESMAYIGNVGEGKLHGKDVDIINSKRSTGSLLKPMLYAMAINDGLISPWQLLPDIPMYYKGFAPQNFDKKFSGAARANEALRSSLNIPFVHLLKDYGYENFHHKLNKMGVSSLNKDPGHYGLTLILGGGEMTMWELTALYAGLVRSVTQLKAMGSIWSSNSYLKQPEIFPRVSEIKLSPAAAWHTLKSMQELRRPDQESSWERFGSSRPIAWKTGTSYGHKDAWAIGVNSKYVVGVWMGNADGEGRSDLVGVTAASPLMFRIFGLLEGDANFPMPINDMIDVRICKQSGFKANQNCPEASWTYVSKGISRTLDCPYHKIIQLDIEKKNQVNSACYPVANMTNVSWFILPPAQARYYKKRHIDYKDVPEYLAGCYSEGEMMEMIYPRQFTKVYIPVELDSEKGRVVFEAAHQNPSSRIFWHLDEDFIGVTENDHQIGMYPSTGKHFLSLVDEFGRELNIEFDVLNDVTSN